MFHDDDTDGFDSLQDVLVSPWFHRATTSSLSAHVTLCPDRYIHPHMYPEDTSVWNQLSALGEQVQNSVRRVSVVRSLLLFMYGKRRFDKRSVSRLDVTERERNVYDMLQKDISCPMRLKHITSFVQKPNITKRLVNYFIVHYVAERKGVTYYLDYTTYPYQILGRFGDPQQPVILAKIEAGASIAWIDVHQEYKSCKSRFGRRNMHAPYARSNTVGTTGPTAMFSISELSFYTWFDSIGGIQAFKLLENDIRKCKRLFDSRRRLRSGAESCKPRASRCTLGTPIKGFTLQIDNPPAYCPSSQAWKQVCSIGSWG